MAFSNKNIERFVVDSDDLYSDKLKSEGIHFKKCNVEKEELPFEVGSIDVIIMNHFLEHLQNPLIALEKSHNIMKKEGLLIIRVPDISKVKWSFYDDFTHVTSFVKGKLRNILITSKFNIQYMENFNYERFMASFLFSNQPSLFWSRFGKEIIAISKK